jgi:hypothetical protein
MHIPIAVHLVNWSMALLDIAYAKIPPDCKSMSTFYEISHITKYHTIPHRDISTVHVLHWNMADMKLDFICVAQYNCSCTYDIVTSFMSHDVTHETLNAKKHELWVHNVQCTIRSLAEALSISIREVARAGVEANFDFHRLSMGVKICLYTARINPKTLVFAPSARALHLEVRITDLSDMILTRGPWITSLTWVTLTNI